ncbi:uncharacterized protein LOC135079569 [Ostrinia nubilalis]|uniref:uncharacterized protein LOC135079569 n=1 Tax=Ostrinia nubilalis TaxID=29057 RepID=UPI00308243D4
MAELRQPEDQELGAEFVVDSTAPVEEILQNLIEREHYSKAYKFYRYLLVQRRHTANACWNLHYTLPGHPLKVFADGWDGDIELDYFEPFPYRSTMPKIITPMRNMNKTDPVTDYMKMKNDWKHEIAIIKKQSGRKVVRKLNNDVMQVSKFLIDLAATMEKDPDPNFDSTFNWYYAGSGNLQLVCINWVDYLLHSEFSVVYLTRFHRDSTVSIENEHTSSFDCKAGNILETICSSQNIVALRTKRSIIMLKIIETDDNINFELLKKFDSDVPFTSIRFDKHHTNILYVTTLDGNLKIVNVDRVTARSVKLVRQSKSDVNNWNCVIGGERATYAHIERRSITFYDKRTHDAVFKWSGLRQIIDEVRCNDITAATLVEGSPALYFATDHHLFLFDARNSGAKRPLLRWTHGLKCAPTYLAVASAEDNREVVVVTSQWCEDACVVSNYSDCVQRAGAAPGVCLPYHPPNLLQVLHEARLRMLCCSLASPIERRLSAATTGLLALPHAANTLLLTHNSLGDIAYRTIHPDYMESFMDDDSAQKLHEWSRPCEAERKPIEVSRVTNIANLWKKLKKIPEDFSLVPTDEPMQFDDEKVYEAFMNEEIMPELLDAWNIGGTSAGPRQDDDSLALHLHFDDSDEG